MTPDLFLFRQSLRDMLRPRTLVLAAFVIGLPAVLALMLRVGLRGTFQGAPAYSALSSLLIFGFLLIILAVVVGSGVISQETEQRTIVYLLTRPIPRWRIALMKYAAAVLGILVVVWAATLTLGLACFGPTGMFGEAVRRDLSVLPLGVLAYGGISLLLATLLHRPLIAGLVYGFLWESFLPWFPGDFDKLSLLAYLRTLARHSGPQDDAGLAAMLRSISGETITPSFAWKVLLAVSVIALVAALMLFSRREFVPREESA
jgi:ABC-2 type transport system permease protein